MDYISNRRKIFDLLFSGKVGFLLLTVLCVVFTLLPGGPFMDFEADWVAVRTLNAVHLPYDKIQSVIFSRAIYFITGIFGDEEFCFRLLNIPFAILTLIGTALLGKKYGGKVCAVNAAWLLLGSFGFLFWCKLAADAMVVCALGVWGTVLLLPGQEYDFKNNRRLCFVKIFSSAVVLLSGILLGDTIIFIVLPLFLFVRKLIKREKFIFNLTMIAAVVSAILVMAAIIIVLTANFYGVKLLSMDALKQAWDFVFMSLAASRNNFPELFARGKWIFGLTVIAEMFLPWLLFLAVAVAATVKNWQRYAVNEKALLIFIAIMVVLLVMVSGRKISDYLIIVPFMTVFVAGYFNRLDTWFVTCNMVMRYLIIIFASMITALPITLPLWKILLNIEPPLPLMVFTPLIGVVVLLIMTFVPPKSTYIDRLLGMRLPFSTTLTAGTLLSAVVMCIMLPVAQNYRSDRQFWRYSGKHLKKDGNKVLLLFGVKLNASSDYYFKTGQTVFAVADEDELLRIMKQNKCEKAALIAPLDAHTRMIFGRVFVNGFDKPVLVEKAVRDNFFTSVGTVPNQQLALWYVVAPQGQSKNEKPFAGNNRLMLKNYISVGK